MAAERKSSMRSNGRKRLGTALMAAGLCLLAASLALVLHNRAEARQAALASQERLVLLDQQIEEAPPYEPAQLAADTVEIDGETYLGTLQIPDLGLELPILSEWSYPLLRVAPCRYTGSLQDRDLVLMAHNYARHFGRLSDLIGGEAVYFRDVHGRVASFAVAEVEILRPGQIEEMTAGEYPLTLFTCTYGGKTRVAVRCLEMKN